ncbi:hypothetical protein DPQ33_11105 [Oceanidesulfovibrio indonesiensis]|uniref:Uncharacterized protein n=1 Tax=Oceanidesulfovibrio indonesiensis TaxID=54767 RepID=A0A7M3MEQ6_9BACT|nr:hypothetical protein DPQ33_11105 [Oceanidesulfovibrio indonesiensis]
MRRPETVAQPLAWGISVSIALAAAARITEVADHQNTHKPLKKSAAQDACNGQAASLPSEGIRTITPAFFHHAGLHDSFNTNVSGILL